MVYQRVICELPIFLLLVEPTHQLTGIVLCNAEIAERPRGCGRRSSS